MPVLRIYNADGDGIGTLSGGDLPAAPLAIGGTNELGYLQIVAGGRTVYIRPTDVKHTLCYCMGGGDVRRAEGMTNAAGTPGIRKGAGSGDQQCVPRQ